MGNSKAVDEQTVTILVIQIRSQIDWVRQSSMQKYDKTVQEGNIITKLHIDANSYSPFSAAIIRSVFSASLVYRVQPAVTWLWQCVIAHVRCYKAANLVHSQFLGSKSGNEYSIWVHNQYSDDDKWTSGWFISEIDEWEKCNIEEIYLGSNQILHEVDVISLDLLLEFLPVHQKMYKNTPIWWAF